MEKNNIWEEKYKILEYVINNAPVQKWQISKATGLSEDVISRWQLQDSGLIELSGDKFFKATSAGISTYLSMQSNNLAIESTKLAIESTKLAKETNKLSIIAMVIATLTMIFEIISKIHYH